MTSPSQRSSPVWTLNICAWWEDTGSSRRQWYCLVKPDCPTRTRLAIAGPRDWFVLCGRCTL